jgi:hypothetical protein
MEEGLGLLLKRGEEERVRQAGRELARTTAIYDDDIMPTVGLLLRVVYGVGG